MPFTKEVITLQVGHYANFVGTHWWNLQESQFSYNPNCVSSQEVDHEVLFREGLTLQNEVTFTPRLIAVDLKANLNVLKPEGTLYDLSNKTSDAIWENYSVHKVEACQKNEFLQDLAKEEDEYLFRKEKPCSSLDFKNSSLESNSGIPSSKKIYNLDSSVEVWSDFLRLHFHPKSILTLPGYHHGSVSENFDVFGYGSQALLDSKTLEAFEDKLHFFSEECDHLQGFQFLLDTHDGFGGVATSIQQILNDEFPSKGILTWSVHPIANQVNTNSLINTLFSFEKLSGFSSLLSPLSLAQNIGCRASKTKVFPYINYNESLNYHTSAILGAYLDSVTLPYRLKTHQTDLRELAQNLTITGKSMVLSSLGFPFVLGEDSMLTQSLEELNVVPWQCLTPGCDLKSYCNMQTLVLRGIPKDKIKNRSVPSFNSSRQMSQKLYQSCSSVDEILKVYAQQLFPSTINACYAVDNACKVIAPFPHIFSSFVNKDGLISNTKRSANEGVDQVPVIAGLHASKEISKLLQHLLIEAQHCNIRKCPKFFDAGLEMDDYKEMLNNVECLNQSYQDS